MQAIVCHTEMRRAILLLALMMAAAASVVLGFRLVSAAAMNLGALRLNAHLAEQPGFSMSPDEGQSQIGDLRALGPGLIGYRYLLAQEREQARLAFRSDGWNTAEFLAMADIYTGTDPERAATWLSLAHANEPASAAIHLKAGRLCQPDWSLDPLCESFLNANGGNRFINSAFTTSDLSGWVPVKTDGASYSLDPCEGDSGALCAHISVSAPLPMPAAGLGQCFAVTPGTHYRYSVWLRVRADATGAWRPLYLQGSINGETAGNWPGDETGPSDWGYWERDYVAQLFDDGRACFSPIRLLAGGEAWFRDAALIPLTGGAHD